MHIYRKHFEKSSKTQNKRKHQPNESTQNMSSKLSNALSSLLGRETDLMMKEVNKLIENYTEKDLQEALLEKDVIG
jgi:hypothetical protein